MLMPSSLQTITVSSCQEFLGILRKFLTKQQAECYKHIALHEHVTARQVVCQVRRALGCTSLIQQEADRMQASVKNIGRVVQRMPGAQLLPELQSPDLLPGLFEAFDHHSADVRKAVTMCLMYMWQVYNQSINQLHFLSLGLNREVNTQQLKN